MKSGQRIIKYLAVALAIFIIVSITSAILFSFNIFSDILGLTRESNPKDKEITTKTESSKMLEEKFDNTQIASVKIEIAYSNLTIIEGESFAVKTNNNYIESKQSNDKLIIKEKTSGVFRKENPSNVIVTLPKNTVLDTVKIEAGAGEIKAEKIITKNLELEIGAGKVTIQDLQVTHKAKIEGGAGSVNIEAGEISNLDLDMGVGSFKIDTILLGNNKIEAGVGKLEINLVNGLDNYTIRANKGIGSIKIGDKEAKNNVEYGKGETSIRIDGGLGNIEIK